MPLLDPNQTYFKPLNGNGHQSVALPATVWTFNAPKQCNSVRVQALTQAIRYTLDGTAPTATVGFQLAAAGAPIILYLSDTTTLRFIREADGAVLQLQPGA